MQLTIDENLDLELATARKLGKVPQPKPDWASNKAWAQANRPRLENNPGQPHMTWHERCATQPAVNPGAAWPFNQPTQILDEVAFTPETESTLEMMRQTILTRPPRGGSISGRMTSTMPSLSSIPRGRDAFMELHAGLATGFRDEVPAWPHLPANGPRDPTSSRHRDNPYLNHYDIHRCWWVRYVHARRARTLRRRGEVIVFAGWHHGRVVYKWWRNGDEGRIFQ